MVNHVQIVMVLYEPSQKLRNKMVKQFLVQERDSHMDNHNR